MHGTCFTKLCKNVLAINLMIKMHIWMQTTTRIYTVDVACKCKIANFLFILLSLAKELNRK